MKKAVIIYGAPGAGKGTQANLLAWSRGFIHFDTGKYIEQLVHDPSLQKRPDIRRERKNFESGALTTPSWILKIVSKKTKAIAKAGFNIVFSGSPRTLYEAFGSNTDQGLIEVLEKVYGKKNIYPVFLKVKPQSSIFRNSNRMVCSVCANAVLYSDAAHQHKTCPLCGGKMRKRVLDNPETIKVRLREYKNRTEPILSGLKKKGYKIVEVSGEKKPFEVFAGIVKKLKV